MRPEPRCALSLSKGVLDQRRPELVEGLSTQSAKPIPICHRIHDVTGIPTTEIRSERIHRRLPSLDWRHV
jgi:hypothetical protein